MFCTNCGNKLNSDDNFCGKCAKSIRNSYNSTPEHKISKIESSITTGPATKPVSSYTPPVNSRTEKREDAKANKKKEELRAELIKIMEKNEGREITESELTEAEINLTGFAELMWDFYQRDKKREAKLKENPKGFHLEGEGYTCFICSNHVSNQETWYDKYGIKCLICQKAIDKKIIPATCASNKESWYSQYDLESRFNINRHGIKRFIKEGILKPRIVPNDNGSPHAYLFLIKDNVDTLPPKKLTESQLVKETKEGKDWYHSEPWYRFVDPVETLKGYKIMDHLKVVIKDPKDGKSK